MQFVHLAVVKVLQSCNLMYHSDETPQCLSACACSVGLDDVNLW